MRLFSLLIGLFVRVLACAQQVCDPAFQQELDGLLSHSVKEVDPTQIDTNCVVYLDARPAEEYVVSHIPGALRIGYRQKNLAALSGLPKDANIVVYCSVGYRSEKVAEDLRDAGYTNVKNLFGGIFEWKNQGNVVVNGIGSTEKVHTYNKKWSKWLKKGERVW